MTTPDQLRAARAILDISQAELSRRTGHSAMTIRRAETNGGPAVAESTIASIRAALESAGVVFTDTNGNGPGVALRKAEAVR